MTDSTPTLRRGPLGGIKDWTLALPRHKDLRNVARFLSFYLDANGNAFPSMELIADECVMSWRTVRKLLAWLIDLGFLADTGRRVGPAQVRVLHVVGYVPAEWQMRNAMRPPSVDNLSPAPALERAAPARREQTNRGTSFNTEVQQPKTRPPLSLAAVRQAVAARVAQNVTQSVTQSVAQPVAMGWQAVKAAHSGAVGVMDALASLLPAGMGRGAIRR